MFTEAYQNPRVKTAFKSVKPSGEISENKCTDKKPKI